MKTNTALKTLSEQVQQQMCDIEVRQLDELNSSDPGEK
jgi:hypothetical protein